MRVTGTTCAKTGQFGGMWCQAAAPWVEPRKPFYDDDDDDDDDDLLLQLQTDAILLIPMDLTMQTERHMLLWLTYKQVYLGGMYATSHS